MNNRQTNNVSTSNRALPFLLLLFLGSGCAALIYEIVWLQLLQLVIGLTAVSLGVLLGVFMGGMCLGSLLLPKLVSARHHPLKVYALLELGIGVLGILVLFVVRVVAEAYSAHGGSGFGNIALRGVVAAACLLPPTLLMGATLPAMSRWVETTPQGVSWLGFFYGGNIVGAVFGSLLAGFYLLPKFNMATATFVAAGINGVVALLGLVLAALTKHTPPVETAPKTVARARGARAIYVTIALSGLCALGAEVVWTRLMGLMLGATVYTFSLILAIFLVGLGIGSTAGAFVARVNRRPGVALGVCQLLIAVAAAWAATMITKSIPNWPINPQLSGNPWYLFQLDLAICAWTILPAAILWGASFPLALASVAAPGQDPGKLVGGVYAANTVGAILGAVGFSLLVVPMGGTILGQRLLIVLSGVSSVIALVPQLFSQATNSTDAPPLKPQTSMLSSACLIAALAGLAWLAADVTPIPWGVVAYGRFGATYTERLKQPGIVAESEVPMNGNPSDVYCTYMGEGLNGTVCVTYRPDGVRSFHSAGKVQASNDPQDMRLQRLLGHISALAFDEPKTVLVVACGAGVTAGSFVLHPSIKRIVICDIEPLVPDNVTPMFKKENYDVVHDKRVEIVHDDGRHFIRTTKEKFDIISSDPIDPWVKGCAALNTTDYYEMCKAHLNPGGVVSLWMALYENREASVKSLISTFFEVFPNGVLWSNDNNGEGYDAVLFGQVEPTKIDVDKWQARLDQPNYALVKQSLEEVGFHSAVDMLATYAGQARDLGPWRKDAEINTDKNLRLQYLAGMSFNSYIGTEILNGITKYYRFPDEIFSGSDEQKGALKEKLKQHKP